MKFNILITLLFLHYHFCDNVPLDAKETIVKYGEANLLLRKNDSNFAIENTHSGKLLKFTLGEFVFESYEKAKPNSISFELDNKTNIKTTAIGFNRTTNNEVSIYKKDPSFKLEWNAQVKLCWQYDSNTWLTTFHGSTNNKLALLLLNIDGFALLFEDYRQIQWNEAKTKLCITPRQIDQPQQEQDQLYWMKIFVSNDIKSVFDTTIDLNYLKKTQQIYNIDAHYYANYYYKVSEHLQYPVWSISSNLINNNQRNFALDAKNFVSKIKENFDGGKISLHFDGKWQKYDGDFAFYLLDPKELVQQIHLVDASAQISFPVNIFINNCSSNFEMLKFMMLKNRSSEQILIDNDMGGRLDLTRSSVQKWFFSKLNNFCSQTANVSFRLETGKSSFDANSLFLSKTNLSTRIRSYFVGECSAKMFSNYLLIVQIDQNVDSNFERNLQSLIPIALSLGLNPQMAHIVPNLVSENAQTNKPSEELYIRWVQATALMPLMKFSIPPWLYNNQTVVDIVAKCIDLHAQFVPTISSLAAYRKPIVQPMWRVFPEDTKTFTIKDQFMLGDEIVVAPVTVVGQRERSVYLPKGIWIDQHDNGYTGPGVFRVKAPLEELPYFKLFEKLK